MLVDPAAQLMAGESQSNSVEPLGQFTAGTIPAARPATTVNVADAKSSSVVMPLSGVESLSMMLLEMISAVLVIVVPALAEIVPLISSVALAPGASVGTDQTLVPALKLPAPEADEKVNWPGNVSRTAIPDAEEGEFDALLTVRRYIA